MHRLFDPQFLRRLGPVLRVATEDMVKGEMPHEIERLISRLRQLEPIARPHQARAPDRR